MAAVPTLFYIFRFFFGGQEERWTQSMEKKSNKTFDFQLDAEQGTLHLSNLLKDAMVYLYDEEGELKMKECSVSPSLDLKLPGHGIYILVIFHPMHRMLAKKIVF